MAEEVTNTLLDAPLFVCWSQALVGSKVPDG